MTKVIAIVGPTAVGKSALGLQLAKEFPGEIISGDSMQIYRHLNIGTAKDSPDELKMVPHHLVDICDVDQRYTVKDFQSNARKIIQQLTKENIIPFIVGGTGFYLNSLIQNLDLGGQQDADDSLRSRISKIEQEQGIDGLQDYLQQLDPKAYQKIDIDNPRRVIRAIEVFETSGHSITEQENGQSFAEFYLIGLTDDRQKLYQRINSRVDKMIDLGLINEARPVYQRQKDIPQAKNGIGYKELFPYFAGDASLDECVIEIKKNSRHFAKRQLTYFRNQMQVNWHNISEEPDYLENIRTEVSKFLAK
ncbi:tRNA (adenosine(37)-N6)-dimethylallyltransferase MiaA [Companilactobacillus versmoldensis]|uniref:tRNA dimethylallyltransferase n=1 Tax=Companilactobacillus versmoldensis DSM 14857 = KCTC 3814 TaxID=1423815 RepID=A0A0R1SIE9_9LACO|nr:tRNA (adenosine(37)-N6)-dimethylallyltransferase MiaA [Companilactobacillus versmoldensis]KRL68366.1 tRNA dimethylallyltransferase [Companilactobacillus versmoldensis DSM 14857 = KCTC 3814]